MDRFLDMDGLWDTDWFSDLLSSAPGRSSRSEEGVFSEEECRQMLAQMEARIHDFYIRAFSLFRHEWMNDIQLLIGYARLKKYDKLMKHMEMIKEKAASESALFKLGHPRLALFLYLCQTGEYPVRLRCSMTPDLQLDRLLDDPQWAAEQVKRLVEHFFAAARGDGERELRLGMKVEDGALHVRFEYAGEYDRSRLEQEVERQAAAGWRMWTADFGIASVQVDLRIPVREDVDGR
jgi:sensor histidine kinase regulating citrate/malate metabolism